MTLADHCSQICQCKQQALYACYKQSGGACPQPKEKVSDIGPHEPALGLSHTDPIPLSALASIRGVTSADDLPCFNFQTCG